VICCRGSRASAKSKEQARYGATNEITETALFQLVICLGLRCGQGYGGKQSGEQNQAHFLKLKACVGSPLFSTRRLMF
jgi:hypothetical protein